MKKIIISVGKKKKKITLKKILSHRITVRPWIALKNER